MNRLSVIVPIYNAEKYLKRCVASILSQSWQDLELILVDDGSKDGSGQLCDELASSDERCKVIHKPNGGVSSARNAGLAAATGEFVAFVDSDDYCAPDMYEKLFAKVEGGIDIVQCDFMLDYGTSKIEERLYDVDETDKVRTLSNFILSGMGGGCVNMIIRRELLVENDLKFPEKISGGEDFLFVLRLLTFAGRIAKVREPLYYYDRTNEASITHTVTADSTVRLLKGYEEGIAFLKEQNLFEQLKDEFFWNTLRLKSFFLFSRKDVPLVRTCIPESNEYISSCPLLSQKMKFAMSLAAKGLGIAAFLLATLYKITRR